MTIRQSIRPSRCAHPECRDVINKGENYEVIERERYHLECAAIRRDEISKRYQ